MSSRRAKKTSVPGFGRFRVLPPAVTESKKTNCKPEATPDGQNHQDAREAAADESEEVATHVVAIPSQRVDTSAVYRNQLAAEFLQTYYPDSMPGSALVRGKLQRWFEPRQGAIALAAADGLLLQYAAKACKACNNAGMRQEAMKRHQSALQLLRLALQRPNATSDETIFGAVDVLGVYDKEFIAGQRMVNEEANGAHARGMRALILSRGPRVLDSGLARDVTLNSLHLALMSSLIARKACVFGQSAWQARLYSSEGRPWKMSELVALGFLLPRLLEKTDCVAADPTTSYADRTLLLAELVDLERRLLDWLVERYANHSDGPPYRVRTVNRGTPVKELTGLEVAYPFDVVLEHTSFLNALAHFNYWSLLLLLRLTILQVGSLTFEDLLNNEPRTSPTKQRKRWEASCAETADSFCQSVPYIFVLQGAPHEIAIQTVCSFLLPLVRPWYEHAGENAKAAWCSALMEFARKEDLRPGLSFAERVRNDYLTKAYFGWINLGF